MNTYALWPRIVSRFPHFAISLLLPLLFGCASVPTDAGFQDVQTNLQEREASDVHWYRGTEDDQAVADSIVTLLAQPLDLAAVTQIALLKNPELQVLYEELGVSQAELVKAGLLENPVLGASIRFPDRRRSLDRETSFTAESGGGFSVTSSSQKSFNRNNIEFALIQDFLDLLMLPMRTKLAAAEFEKVKLQVSHEVLTFIADVHRAYYEYVAAVQTAELLETVATATSAASEFAVRQYEAGNLSRLEMERENAFHAHSLLEAARAQLDVRLKRERLGTAMGIWERTIDWQLSASRLDSPPLEEVQIDGLEPYAIANRYDLAARVKNLEMLIFGVDTTRRWRWLGLLDVSVSAERDGDGVYVTGPALELELPIFDQGQTELAIAESNVRAESQRISSLALHIRMETREAVETLVASRDVVDYYERVLLPAHQKIMDESQLHYNAMLIGVYDLLLDKRQQIETAMGYVQSIKDFWLARTELEMAVGGSLPQLSETHMVHESGEGNDDRVEPTERIEDSQPPQAAEHHHQ